MTTPDEPGPSPPPGMPPPPPYPRQTATPSTAAPPSTPVAVRRKRRLRNPLVTLLIGLVIGILLGGAGGYLLFNGRTVAITTTPQATASPSPTTTATALPSTSEPVQTTIAAPQGVVPCPAPTPTGQHTLGTPGGPGSGQARAAGLDFCGGGSATIPTGTTRFLTSANWGLGIADSCPVGSSGQSGMNTVLTVTEVLPGGSQGPDTATEAGDWEEGGTVLMATGGSYQLRVATVLPGCVWHIAVYPS